jgi:hypothetical protein
VGGALRVVTVGIAVVVLVLAAAGTATATVTIDPAANPKLGPPGSTVEFRKGPAGWEGSYGDSVEQADALFALPLSNSNVIADGTDNGVSTIYYLDGGGGYDFGTPRDVGSENFKMLKGSGSCCSSNSATFNPFNTDNEFAMEAKGYIYIPSSGDWTFAVKTDDASRLVMGTNDELVTECDCARAPGWGNTTSVNSVAYAPSAGYYPYTLTWTQGNGGAMVEFVDASGSYPEPQCPRCGYEPGGARLVGDTGSGGLAVYQQPPAASAGKPVLTTAASVSQGHVLSDTATVHGGNDPGGELVFQLFGQSDPNCQNDPLQSSTVPVHGDGDYGSGSFTVQDPGTYNFLVFYEPGSSPNQSTRTGCGGGSESVTVYPPPSVSISTPANGAFYALRQVVSSSFACVDGSGAPGIASCSGPVTDAAPVDTSSLGVHSFTVTATSQDGWTASATNAYTVVGAPFVTFSMRRRVTQGRRAFVHFRCGDGAGGPGIRSCRGSVRSRSRLNTRRLGRHVIRVTATSGDGLSRTYTFSYRVVRSHRRHRTHAAAAALDPLLIW